VKRLKALFSVRAGSPGYFFLEGELSFASVMLALKKTAWIFGSSSDITFDLTGVERADSAGVALLLEWRRRAGQGGATLRYVNLPDQLRAIMRVAGIDGILAFP
jgi:phospholipid transport system transporter-binding protein